jgi:ADP-ribosylglycohydrolase
MSQNGFNRRQFLGHTGVSVVGAGVLAAAAGNAAPAVGEAGGKPGPSGPSLFDKIYGCLAGTYIGSSMGVAVEGWHMDRIAQQYGVLKEFKPFRFKGWECPPGSTEDGMERQKLMCRAIIDKQDRITAEDLVDTWRKVMDDEKTAAMAKMTEGFDRDLMALAKTRAVPAGQLGTLVKYSHLNTTVRSCHAIALINACDPEGVIRDLYDVARVYQPLSSDGYPWGAAYNAALVDAMKPDATVQSVIDTALRYAAGGVRGEIQRALDIAKKYENPMEMRKEFYQIYSGTGTAYAQSWVNETAAKALAVFAATKGNVKDAIIVAVNFGRDTDCLGASAGGLAGAFSGTRTIPPEWIETVDKATQKHPYTNSRLTIKETAEGLYGALRNKVRKMKQYVALMEAQFQAR